MAEEKRVLKKEKRKLGIESKLTKKTFSLFVSYLQGFTTNSQLAKEIIMHNEPHLLEPGVDCIMTKYK